MRSLAVRHGVFGKIRIVERVSDGARFYLPGGSVQSLVDEAGVSLLGYVNALKLMLRGRRRVLVIGGGGGSLPTMLARKGHSVEVVDIDPVAEELAREFFWLDPRVEWITEDALTLLDSRPESRSRPLFDAIVVDACTTQSTVSAFTDPDWLAEAMNWTVPGGTVLVNLSYEEPPPDVGLNLADALAERGYHAVLLQPQYGWEGNEILQISRTPSPVAFARTDVLARPAEARSYLLSLNAYQAAPRADAAACGG